MRLYYKKVDTLSGSILIITRYRESDLSFGLFIHLETRRTTSLRTRQYLSRAVNSSTFPRNSNRELEPGSPLKGIESIVETERPVSFLFPVPPPLSLSSPPGRFVGEPLRFCTCTDKSLCVENLYGVRPREHKGGGTRS